MSLLFGNIQQQESGPVYPSNLQAYYRFDEGTGTSTSELINGSANGTTTASWTTGKNNGCLYYDGTGVNTSVATNSNVSFSGSFTISVWVMNMTKTRGWIVSKGSGTNINYHVNQEYGRFRFGLNAGGGYKYIQSPSVYSYDTWYMVTGVYNSAIGMVLYVNGTSVATYSKTGAVQTNTNTMYIGKSVATTAYHYQGKIDEISMWNTALSASEITTLYNSGSGVFY